MKEEAYFSVDVETDGPIPGDNSMLSFGAALFDKSGNLQSTFYANLETLPGAKQNQETMKWWSQNEYAYNATRQGTQPPKLVMERFVKWVESHPVKPVFVGYPAGFDFLFMYWYMMHFVGRSPFSFSALDIKSYAMAVLKTEYRKSTKRNMPKHWFPEEKHSHIALDDAIEQGKLFINILKENLGI
jgi:DNA polymerase III alpha subunit (gram-positive type)